MASVVGKEAKQILAVGNKEIIQNLKVGSHLKDGEKIGQATAKLEETKKTLMKAEETGKLNNAKVVTQEEKGIVKKLNDIFIIYSFSKNYFN